MTASSLLRNSSPWVFHIWLHEGLWAFKGLSCWVLLLVVSFAEVRERRRVARRGKITDFARRRRRCGSAGWFGYRGYSRRVQRTTGAKKRRIQMRVALLAMALTLTASPAVNDVASSPTAAVRADGTVVDHKSERTYIEERVKVIGDRTELKGLIGKDGIARKYDSSTGRYFVEFPEWLGARPSASADVPRPGPAVVNYDIHPVDLELVPILSMHAVRKQRDRRREQEREREEEEPKDEL